MAVIVHGESAMAVTPPSDEWTAEEKERLRPLLARMLTGGASVKCPVDGEALKVDVAVGLAGHREASVTCPRCRRRGRFDSL